MKHWLLQNLIALDQLLNTLFFGGWADETMSSASYRMNRDGYFWGLMRPVIDTILWFDKNHCQQSYEAERQRLQLPPEDRP